MGSAPYSFLKLAHFGQMSQHVMRRGAVRSLLSVRDCQSARSRTGAPRVPRGLRRQCSACVSVRCLCILTQCISYGVSGTFAGSADRRHSVDPTPPMGATAWSNASCLAAATFVTSILSLPRHYHNCHRSGGPMLGLRDGGLRWARS